MIEWIIVVTGLLLVMSVVLSTVSNRLGIPALVLFLAIGMLAGSDGPGGIAFDNAFVAQFVGVIALIYILYAGGLDTSWPRIRRVLVPSLVMANVGVVISAVLLALFAVLILDLPPLVGLLLGSVISSTDAAAVFSVLRSVGVQMPDDVEALIECESGSNDPIAVLLTLGITGLLTNPDLSLAMMILNFVVQMVVGALCGLAGGWLISTMINRLNIKQDGLYPVLSLALVLFLYGATTLVYGNGFLAVYAAGIVVGNSALIHKRSLTRFHEGIAWLMQIAMFLTLGLLVFPRQLPAVALSGLLLAFLLMVVVRPISVFITLAFSRFNVREKMMISWAGLRGAVPIVLATFPLLAGVQEAPLIFDVVFFIVVTSVIIQGMSIGPVARLLGLHDPAPRAVEHTLEFIPEISLESRIVEVPVPENASPQGRTLLELQLPAGALIVLVRRGLQTVVPSGSTRIFPGDRLLLVATPEAESALRQRFALQPT